MQLSGIYERHGELTNALEFAIMARDKHSYSEWCGVMVASVHREVGERIDSLRERLDDDGTKPLPADTQSRRTAANPPLLRR